MRRAALMLALLPGCAGLQGGGLKAVEAAACAVEDERLSVAFTDPAKAKAGLKALGERLKDRDEDAIREAADLIAALVGCIPEGETE